jgi:hypothetical protein
MDLLLLLSLLVEAHPVVVEMEAHLVVMVETVVAATMVRLLRFLLPTLANHHSNLKAPMP